MNCRLPQLQDEPDTGRDVDVRERTLRNDLLNSTTGWVYGSGPATFQLSPVVEVFVSPSCRMFNVTVAVSGEFPITGGQA